MTEKKMTVKQIASAVGKPESTVKGWVKKTGTKIDAVRAKIDSAGHGKSAEYTLDETIAIIEQGMGKNAASIFRANAEHNMPVISSADPDMHAKFEAAVVGIYGILQNLDGRITNIEKRVEKRAALLPAPQKTDRASFNQLVREYATKQDIPYSAVYGKIYSEIYYRLGINASVQAKHTGVPVLEWIEDNGYMSEALAIAIEILK